MSFKRVKVRSRRPRHRIIRIGTAIDNIKAAVNKKYYISDDDPFTMPIEASEGRSRETVTVAHIRFKGCLYEIYIVIGNACASFGKWAYRPGEVIYYHRKHPETIHREVFMIFADEVKVRPPHADEKIMYEPCCYGKPWVDLMWEKNIESIDRIDEHFRNPEMSPELEDIFKFNCSNFFRTCRLALDNRLDLIL